MSWEMTLTSTHVRVECLPQVEHEVGIRGACAVVGQLRVIAEQGVDLGGLRFARSPAPV